MELQGYIIDNILMLIDKCHQQIFCEVIFCFEKEVTSFYRNYSLRNSGNSYLSVNCM